MARSEVLAGYRGVLRAIHKVFGGDADAVRNAVAQARTMTRANAGLSSPEEVAACVAELVEGEAFLREHVVQAALTEQGSYAMKVEDRHVGRDGARHGPVWAKATDEGAVALEVHVQPGAKAPGITGEHGERLKLKVGAVARDGQANDAVVDLLSRAFGVRTQDVTVDRGRKSREKLVTVRGVSLDAVLEACGWTAPEQRGSEGGLQLQAAHDAAAGALKDPGACGCADHDHDHDHARA